MFRTATFMCAVSLAVTGTLRAADVIETEKLPTDRAEQAIRAASDDTIVEIRGQSKTKAEWRSEFQAKHQPPDAAKLKAIAAEQKAKFESAQKAFNDQKEQDIATQNAEVMKEFEELKAR